MQSRFPTGRTAPSASGDVCIPARSCACGVWCVHLCLRVSTGMCVHSICVHICDSVVPSLDSNSVREQCRSVIRSQVGRKHVFYYCFIICFD